MNGQLSFYGGNVRVVAAEHEIHRVANQIAAAERLLLEAIFIGSTTIVLQPTLLNIFVLNQLPIWIGRLRFLQLCLFISEQSYLSVEGRVRNLMHEVMPDLTRALAGGIAPATLSNREFAVEQVGSDKRTNAPTTLRTMMNRLQTTAVLANGTVRIESWVEAGRRHFIVYLPGTQDWSPIPGSNPLNLPSDLQAFANSKSDSQSALLLALRNAGAKPGDEIIFVAHSQGGLVAANFAQHPSGFNVSSILSFAAPMVAVGALRGTKVLALEHSNDPMPYLAGKANPIAANWVTIEAEAPKGGIAAHELKSYGAMTTRADKSGTPEIEKARESLLARFRGKRVKVQLVKLKRKPS